MGTPWDCHRTADQARGGARGVHGAAYTSHGVYGVVYLLIGKTPVQLSSAVVGAPPPEHIEINEGERHKEMFVGCVI